MSDALQDLLAAEAEQQAEHRRASSVPSSGTDTASEPAAAQPQASAEMDLGQNLDITSTDVSLEGLDEQLDKFADHEVVRAILDQVRFLLPSLQSCLDTDDGSKESYVTKRTTRDLLLSHHTMVDAHNLLQLQLQRDSSAGHTTEGNCVRALQGCDPKKYRQQYEEKLRAAEMEAIQDYIAENDNLVTLHKEVTAAHALQQPVQQPFWCILRNLKQSQSATTSHAVQTASVVEALHFDGLGHRGV